MDNIVAAVSLFFARYGGSLLGISAYLLFLSGLLVLFDINSLSHVSYLISGMTNCISRWVLEPLAHGLWTFYLALCVALIYFPSPPTFLRSKRKDVKDEAGFQKLFNEYLRRKGVSDLERTERLEVERVGADIPRSVAEAKEHIERIRAEKGVDSHAGATKDLTRALDIFAHDLYKKPSHFLLEILQNVDDNQYRPNTTPTLHLTLLGSTLRVDSNERGFSRKNVESLCSIGHSSKKRDGRGNRYIGQKGIGFKSLFSAADVVHICSGPYSFKFDKLAPLGMLVPIWSDFPQHRLPGMTSVLLELSGEYSRSDLAKELQSIEPRILLFMNKLREINIQIRDAEWSWTSALWSQPDWSRRLARNAGARLGNAQEVNIKTDKKMLRYLTASHLIEDISQDPRREGCDRSEVTVGFPIRESGQPTDSAPCQSVYAFLPVGDFGFKFMIQADFLLVANRENLDDCAWNDDLIAGIPAALLKAVQEVNYSEDRYHWLKYLPQKDGDQIGSFVGLTSKIFTELGGAEIIESSDGEFGRPWDLTFVPKRFRDDEGMPLVPPNDDIEFLSPKYPVAFEKQLRQLKVDILTDAQFMELFEVFVTEYHDDFINHPLEWHSAVSKALSTLCVESKRFMEKIKQLRIVPLANGEWVAADSGHIAFPTTSSTSTKENSDYLQIDPSTLKSPERKKLFQLLGASSIPGRRADSPAPSEFYSNHDLNALAKVAQNVSRKTKLAQIYDLLIHISFKLEHARGGNEDIPSFDKYSMFPVRAAWSNNGFDYLWSAAGTEEWFISDEPRRNIEDLVDMLAVPRDVLDRIRPLIDRLGLASRILDRHLVTKSRLVGSGLFMPTFTEMLRVKAKYMALLVPCDLPDRTLRLERLCNLRVLSAREIFTQTSVHFEGSDIEAEEEPADVALTEGQFCLNVAMLENDLSEGFIPVELGELLCTYCHVHQRNQHIVFQVLSTRDPARIEDFLKRKGVRMDFSRVPTPRNHVAGFPPDFYSLDETISDWDVFPVKRPVKLSDFESLGDKQFHFGTTETHSYISEFKMRQFYAELYISSFLQLKMGKHFDPEKHWTSPLRTKAGHKSFDKDTTKICSFTVADQFHNLRDIFQRPSSSKVEKRKTRFIYHIEVSAAIERLDSLFDFDGRMLAKAMNYTSLSNQNSEHVLVLAFVHNIYKSAKIRFFTDPLGHLLKRSLHLTASTIYLEINDASSAIFAQSSMDAELLGNMQHLYAYRHLAPGQMRLLELLPGANADVLRGKIHQCNIDSPTPFRALSYVWGLAPSNLLGYSLETEAGIVEITPSLDLALRRFRDRKESQWLWVDAICINQKDNLEKSVQIPFLPGIYRVAEEVIAWLGTEEDDSNLAIEFLAGFCSGDPGDASGPMANHWRLTTQAMPITDKLWSIVNRLLARPWFTRAWIVQELVWADKVTLVCGPSSLSWDAFYTAIRMVEYQHRANRTTRGMYLLPDAHATYALDYARRRLKEEGRKIELFDLLDRFAYTRATLSCDKIFALLGLASDVGSGNPLFRADYDSDPNSVFCRFAKGFVQQGRVLDLLYRAGQDKGFALVSWIPDWVRTAIVGSISAWDAGSDGFHAGGQGAPLAAAHHDQLVISGFVVDEIRTVSAAGILGSRGSGRHVSIHKLQDCRAALIPLVGNYPTGESSDDLLVKIPIGNARRPQRSSQLASMLAYRPGVLGTPVQDGTAPIPVDIWSIAELREVLSSVHIDADAKQFSALPGQQRAMYARYCETAVEFASRFVSTRVVSTARGYAGFVSEHAEPGDKISIFPGGKVPFLIRSNGHGHGHVLIGECYVHGIMQGEAIAWDDKVETTFSLR